MMNALALGLVLSSLAAAGVWPPQQDRPAAVPEEHPPGDDVVREGHRLIVLEYERQAPLQRTPSQVPHLPPLEPFDHRRAAGVVEEAKESIKEAASDLPNLGQGVSTPARQDEEEEGMKEEKEKLKAPVHGAKEKICDAYGVCKEKIAGLLRKSKEKAAQVEEGAKEAVGGAVEKAREVKENVAGNVSDFVEHALDRARAGVEKASEMESSAVDKAKEMERGAAWKAREVEGKATQKVKELQRNVTEKAVEVRKNLTDILQRAREVARDAGAYVGARETTKALAAVVHLLAFATAYGTCVWVTFVSSHVLARSLPRQQFGILQSKLYPVYFRAMAYAVSIALLSHALPAAGRRSSATEALQGYILLASLGLIVVNMLLLEPKATKVMFERMKMEKEEGRGRHIADVEVETTATKTSTTTAFGVTRATVTQEVPVERAAGKCGMAKLNRRLKSLNTHSSLLNVMTLMGLTWHLVHLSRRLQASC